MAKPIRITPQMAAQLVFNPSMSAHAGGIWGTIRPGQNYMASDGIRQVVHADNSQIFYFVKGELWGQEAQSFISEIRTYPAIRGAQGAVGMAMLAEFQVNLLLGIVASSTGVGAAIVIGTDVFKFLITNKENFGKWHRMIKAVLKARDTLKTKAPILYERVFDAFLRQLWTASTSGMPAAMSKPDTAGKLTGAMVGKFGTKVLQARFSVLGAVWIILSTVASKVATSVPSAISVSVGEYKKLAEDLIRQLQAIGVSLSQKDAEQIFREIAKNPGEIARVFAELKAAFAAP